MCGESYHLTTDYYFIQGNKTWHLPFLWHIKWLFLLMNAFAKYMCGITVIKLWQGKQFVSNHHIFVKIRIFQISVWEENRSTWSKPTRSQWESLSLRCDPLSSATPGKWYQVHYFQLQTPTVACENHGVYMYICTLWVTWLLARLMTGSPIQHSAKVTLTAQILHLSAVSVMYLQVSPVFSWTKCYLLFMWTFFLYSLIFKYAYILPEALFH